MSKNKKFKIAVLVVALGVAACYVAFSHKSRPVEIGESAPDFTVPALPSGSLNLKSYQGQVVLVNFWATWCPPCVEETPSLVEFSDKLKARGVVVLGISVDDNLDALKNFSEANHISFPVGSDPDRALAARYGTYQFPETYILDRHGRLAEKIIGPTDWSDPRIQEFVLSLAGGAQP